MNISSGVYYYVSLLVILGFATNLADPYHVPKFLVCAVSLLVASLLPSNRDSRVPRDWLTKSILIAFGVYSACAIVSADKATSLFGYGGFYFHGLASAAMCLCAYMMARTDDWEIDSLVKGIVSAAALSSVYGLLQRLGVEPFVGVATDKVVESHRAISTCGSPVFWASVLAVALPLAVGMYFDGRKMRGSICSALILAGLWSTGSRSGMLAGSLGACITIWPRFGRKARTFVVLASVLCVFSVWVQRRGLARSDGGRLDAWRAAISQAIDTPILGRGPDTFMGAWLEHRPHDGGAIGLSNGHSAAHNDLMQILATCGLVGVIAYLLVIWHLLALLRERRDMMPLVGSASAWLIMSMMSPIPFYTTALVALIVGYLSRRDDDMRQYNIRKFCYQRVLICASLALLSILGARMAYADYNAGRAKYSARAVDVLRHQREALRIIPWSLEYTSAYLETLAATHAQLPRYRGSVISEMRRISYAYVRWHPTSKEGYHMIAATALADGDKRGALAFAKRALKQDPNSPAINLIIEKSSRK